MIQGRGVSAIVCEANGFGYVGCTRQPFCRRWREHLSCLGLGRHCNRALQAEWRCSGPGAFRFQALERLSPASFYRVGGDRWRRELAWIRRYQRLGGISNSI